MAESASVIKSDLYKQLELKIAVGNGMITKLSSLVNIRGIEKLEKKILQEVNFLKKISDKKTAKEEHLNCTNVNHFEALVNCLIGCTAVTAVLQRYDFRSSNGENKKIVVDIICDTGRKWVKVIARNPKALTQLSNGNGTFGKRNVFDQVKEYLHISQEHPFLFVPPTVVFHFAAGIETILAKQLIQMGIIVSGCVINNTEDDVKQDGTLKSEVDLENNPSTMAPSLGLNPSSINNIDSAHEPCMTLNLDVTTMLAYVSALTNDNCNGTDNIVFQNPILNMQANCERKNPIKPLLDKLFEGKELICCEAAASSFDDIMRLVAGPKEIVRAQDLMAKVKVVPDCLTVPGKLLMPGGQIHDRSLIVFCTGHHLKAITVSANEGFVRASKSHGVEFAAYLHPARALTEKKTFLGVIVPNTDVSTSAEI